MLFQVLNKYQPIANDWPSALCNLMTEVKCEANKGLNDIRARRKHTRKFILWKIIPRHTSQIRLWTRIHHALTYPIHITKVVYRNLWIMFTKIYEYKEVICLNYSTRHDMTIWNSHSFDTCLTCSETCYNFNSRFVMPIQLKGK